MLCCSACRVHCIQLVCRCCDAVHAEDVINCVQAVLELSSMIAPRTYLELRLKGFALEVCQPLYNCVVNAQVVLHTAQSHLTPALPFMSSPVRDSMALHAHEFV